MTSFNGQKKEEEEVQKCRRENAKIRSLDADVYVRGEPHKKQSFVCVSDNNNNHNKETQQPGQHDKDNTKNSKIPGEDLSFWIEWILMKG